jgi:hypothetical protein
LPDLVQRSPADGSGEGMAVDDQPAIWLITSAKNGIPELSGRWCAGAG